MIKVKKEGIILESTGLEFENQAVLNPTCVKVGNKIHMFYRAVKQGNFSSIGHCILDGPLKVAERSESPVIYPQHDYERHGCEDPRIVHFEGRYYLFYMAYNGKDVVTAYAISKDLKKFEKKGPISCLIPYSDIKKYFMKQHMPAKYFNYDFYDKVEEDTEDTVYIWGKDAFMFPKKIKGKFAMLHRILPNVHVIYFNNFQDLTKLDFWKHHLKHLKDRKVIDTRYWFESRAIGAGCVPIETKKGWLLIYHAIENSPEGRIYRACAALVDKNNPCKLKGKLDYPLFSPEKFWELKGDVDNVVFPSGAIVFGKRLYIYYGAADKRIAVASVDLKELLDELSSKKVK